MLRSSRELAQPATFRGWTDVAPNKTFSKSLPSQPLVMSSFKNSYGPILRAQELTAQEKHRARVVAELLRADRRVPQRSADSRCGTSMSGTLGASSSCVP